MTLSPLLSAPLMVQVHVVAALLALVLAPVILFRRKGTQGHRMMGRVWVGAMFVTALSSFLLSSNFVDFHFGPIHLLSVLVLGSLWAALRAAKQGNIQQHRKIMRSLAFWGLFVTGAATLIPGRLMFTVVSGG